MKNKIIDFHTHLNHFKFKNAYDALKDISIKTKKHGVELSLVLHLDIQPWSIDELGELINEFDNVKILLDMNPNKSNLIKRFEKYITKYNFWGLKLHPRLNNFNLLNEKVLKLVNVAGRLNKPVIVDCFPDGNSLINNFNPSDYGILSNHCKNTNIIASHMGGHFVIDMMLIAKRCQNLYLNLAYTLLYYRGSSVVQDLIYCINSIKSKKIFYGSDYPDREFLETINFTKKEFKKFKLKKTYQENIFYNNAREFLKIYE